MAVARIHQVLLDFFQPWSHRARARYISINRRMSLLGQRAEAQAIMSGKGRSRGARSNILMEGMVAVRRQAVHKVIDTWFGSLQKT